MQTNTQKGSVINPGPGGDHADIRSPEIDSQSHEPAPIVPDDIAPGGEGVAATAPRGSFDMHSGLSDFVPQSAYPEKKSKGRHVKAAKSTAESPSAASDAQAKGDAAAAATSPATEAQDVLTLTVVRLLQNRRLLFARERPQDPREPLKLVSQVKAGRLRPGMTLRAVREQDPSWSNPVYREVR